MKILCLSFFFLVLSACSFFSSTETGVYYKSKTIINNLKVKLPSPWVAISNETSDFAISSNATHSVFLLNSACRKFESSNLNSLASAMLSGVEIVKIIEKKIITHQGREAMDMTVIGKVDGIERFFHIITTQKNNCIYDLVLISTNEKNLKNDNHDFNIFIQRIEFN